jgi:Arm DNA-binding domain
MKTRTQKAQALTAKAIEAMKPNPDDAYRVPDSRCRGLAIRVATDGDKTWDIAYRIKNTGVRRLSLGRYEDIGLERARNRANELTSAARQGRDLIAKEKAARDEYDQSYTIERLIGEYVQRRVTDRLRTAHAVERRLKRAQTSDEAQSGRHPASRSPRAVRCNSRSGVHPRAWATTASRWRDVQVGRNPRHHLHQPGRRTRLLQSRRAAKPCSQ